MDQNKNCGNCKRWMSYDGSLYGRTMLKTMLPEVREDKIKNGYYGYCDYGMPDWLRDDTGPFEFKSSNSCDDFCSIANPAPEAST